MAYERVNWENLPSKNTPVNADNLNKMDNGIANAVEKSGDTMTGDLDMQSNSVKFGTNGNILFKEDGFGDKFRIIPNFYGTGAENKLIIQSTTGEAGTDPQNWKDLVTIHADSGQVDLINLYPVGSIYISVNSTNPATLFGGTWEQIKDKFLLSAGDTYNAGDEGGEATHKLTIDEMPKHKHNANVRINWYDGTAYGPLFNQGDSSHVGVDRETTYTDEVGGGQPHNNMPPYLAVYMWKRIA